MIAFIPLATVTLGLLVSLWRQASVAVLGLWLAGNAWLRPTGNLWQASVVACLRRHSGLLGNTRLNGTLRRARRIDVIGPRDSRRLFRNKRLRLLGTAYPLVKDTVINFLGAQVAYAPRLKGAFRNAAGDLLVPHKSSDHHNVKPSPDRKD